MSKDLKLKISIEILGRDNTNSYSSFQELFKTSKEETLNIDSEKSTVEELQKTVKQHVSESLQATQKFVESNSSILSEVINKSDDPFSL